jgi:DinB superfamily
MPTNDAPARIEAGRARLAALRPAVHAGAPWPLAERFDDAPEASWGPPEVLAHVDEMIGFWHGELARIVAARSTEPVPFGRISTDTARLAAIERLRYLPLADLDASIDAKAAALVAACSAWSDGDLARVGLHPRLGEVTVGFGLQRFIYGHLEDHADQLERALETVTPPD